MRQQAQRPSRRLVVVERLAHAHEHHVAEPLVRVETRTPDEHLSHDLLGPEVTLQPRHPARAEDAAHGATHLRRHALGDPHRLLAVRGRVGDDDARLLVLVLVVHRRGGVGVQLSRERRERAGHPVLP